MLFHLVGAEELGPQGRFRKRGLERQTALPQPHRHALETSEGVATCKLQWGTLLAPDGV